MDKAQLFVDLATRETVDVAAGQVVVRSLSRAEVMLCTKLSEQGPERMEQRQLSLAMLDPELTEGEVQQWQETPGSFRDIQRVVDTVNRLSGIGKDAHKEAYKSPGSEPDTRV